MKTISRTSTSTDCTLCFSDSCYSTTASNLHIEMHEISFGRCLVLSSWIFYLIYSIDVDIFNLYFTIEILQKGIEQNYRSIPKKSSKKIQSECLTDIFSFLL